MSARNLGQVAAVARIAGMVHVFTIPGTARAVRDVSGDRFKATIYELQDGRFAAYVEVDESASDEDLARDSLNSKIRSAAQGQVEYYVMHRRKWGAQAAST